jgi:hypothetical protein
MVNFGLVSSCTLNLPGESIVDAIPLSASEKTRKLELEAIVAHGLQEFLRVGSALAELRNRRLYRTEFGTFESYVQQRFGLHRGVVDGVIRSAQTAQVLLDAGIQLPPTTTAAVLRPICGLPGEELKTACWQLAESFAPERGPTVRLVGKLCAVVREALEQEPLNDDDDPDDDPTRREGSFRGPRPEGFEVPFARPVARLAGWSGFSASIIVAGVDNPQRAAGLYRSCGILVERLRQVQNMLAATYPELACA